MRALTLTQPWAGLVASGIKLVENRSIRMIKTEDFGKPFAIHAGKVIDNEVYKIIEAIAPELTTKASWGSQVDRLHWFRLSQITSSVIAVATIDKVLNGRWTREAIAEHAVGGADNLRWSNGERLGPRQVRWFFGPIGYLLRDVVALPTPVPCRGWQGFWTLDADAEYAVRSQLPCHQGGTHKFVGRDRPCTDCLKESP